MASFPASSLRISSFTRSSQTAPPHDKLYPAYLAAMIDFANGDYDRYQATAAMFNSHFGDYMRWYAQTLRPADREGDDT